MTGQQAFVLMRVVVIFVALAVPTPPRWSQLLASVALGSLMVTAYKRDCTI